MDNLNGIIADIRAFNRFYTDILGLLNQNILDSGFSLTEGRILFEINRLKICSANQIAETLKIDRSYMSRIILKFEKNGLIIKTASEFDSRVKYIHMSEKGLKKINELSNKSHQQIGELLKPLSSDSCKEIQQSMKLIQKNLIKATNSATIRNIKAQELSYITNSHKALYRSQPNLKSASFNKYVDKCVNDFMDNFDIWKDCVLILDYSGKPAGSIAIKHDANRENTAQIRFFLVEEELRGLGLGEEMFDSAIDFCKEKGYTHIFLWTISAQKSARQLYSKKGFRVSETKENTDWAIGTVEEKWEKNL